MPSAPLYRRGDSVYLKSSAELGKLEAYKITSIKQTQSSQWIYQISIGKKPPAQGLIGDSFDARIREYEIYYTDDELITVCEALDIICSRLTSLISVMEAKISAECSPTDVNAPDVGHDESRWDIGDKVYFSASARLGFIHDATVSAIYEIGIQPGSRRTRYIYQVSGIPNGSITFREDELITFCEAANLALSTYQRELAEAEVKRSQLCN